MAELDDHIALMEKRRAALNEQIEGLHEGDRKATLTLMLKEVDGQLQRLIGPRLMAAGKAKAPFKPNSDKMRGR